MIYESHLQGLWQMILLYNYRSYDIIYESHLQELWHMNPTYRSYVWHMNPTYRSYDTWIPPTGAMTHEFLLQELWHMNSSYRSYDTWIPPTGVMTFSAARRTTDSRRRVVWCIGWPAGCWTSWPAWTAAGRTPTHSGQTCWRLPSGATSRGSTVSNQLIHHISRSDSHPISNSLFIPYISKSPNHRIFN